MTIGEDRVRTKFNPSANSMVDRIKQKSAELIDLCSHIGGSPQEGRPSEQARLIALAKTAYEEAAMWAVKAATMPAEHPAGSPHIATSSSEVHGS